MNLLAIETTGAAASVAIINEYGEINEEISSQKLNHLQNLMPMLDNLLKKCRLTIDDLSVIAASEGPGSFTGIRIGISTARALAQVLGIGTIGVPTLKSFGHNAPDYDGIICPIFDARRNQVYGGAYLWNRSEYPEIIEIVPGAAYDLNELLSKLSVVRLNYGAEITFFGDGIDKYKAQIIQWQTASLNDNIRLSFAEGDNKLQKASSIAKMAFEMYKAGDIKNYYELKPMYMRKAEAERKLEASLLG